MIKKSQFFLLSIVVFCIINTLVARETTNNPNQTLATQSQTQPPTTVSPQLQESKNILEAITSPDQKPAIRTKDDLFYIYFPGIKFDTLVSFYSNLPQFQEFLKVKTLNDKLFLIAVALRGDAKNPTGFLSAGFNNWEKLSSKFEQLYETLKKDTRREIKDEYFLLAMCYKVLFEYIKNNINKYEGYERANSFSLLKQLYLFTNICEQESLSRLVTSTLKTAKNSAPFLTSHGYAKKKFKDASTFVNFVKAEFNFAKHEEKLNLEKKSLIKLLFKIGFIFNLYGDNFKKLKQEISKAEYETFLSELLFHILKIQNNIQAKKIDKSSLKEYFNVILLTALREIFSEKLNLISFNEFKKNSLENAIQIFLMILITNNNIEYQSHKKNIATFKKVMLAGLGIIIMSTAVGMMAIMPAVPVVVVPMIAAFTFAPQEIGFDFLINRGAIETQKSKVNLKEQLVSIKTESIFFANYIISFLENLPESIAPQIKNSYITFLAEPGIIKSIAAKIKSEPAGRNLEKKFVMAAMTKIAKEVVYKEKVEEEQIETELETTQIQAEQININSELEQLKNKVEKEKNKRLEFESRMEKKLDEIKTLFEKFINQQRAK